MRRTVRPTIALCAASMLTLWPRISMSYEPACRSSTDIIHHLRPGETLTEIAGRFYCVTATTTIERVWREILAYNEMVAGSNPSAIRIDTALCLPAQVDGNGWSVDRCIARASENPKVPDEGPQKGESTPSPEAGPAVETGKPAVDDGTNARTAASAPQRLDADAPVRAKKKPVLESISVELVGGFIAPSSPTVWNRVHRALGILAIGGRAKLRWIEVAPRLLLVMGNHETNFYGTNPQAQAVLGGGLLAQAGVPLKLGPVQLTPGLELGWARVRREIEITEYPFAGEVERQVIDFVIAGAFVRPEITLPLGAKHGPVVALEVGGDVMPVSLAELGMNANFNIKVVGGVGYAF